MTDTKVQSYDIILRHVQGYGWLPLIEKDGKELVENPGDIFDPVLQIEALKAHLEQLEKAAVEVRHFIESAERPDLGEGALKNEKDKSG